MNRSLAKLRNTHIAAATFHGLQSVAVGLVFAYTQRDSGKFILSQTVRGEIKWSKVTKYLKWMVVAFPVLSMTNHIASAAQISKYRSQPKLALPQSNIFRWSEYAVSAGIMLWIISQLSGITNAPTLILIGLLNISLQAVGYFVEKHESIWEFSFLGWILFVSVWVPIVWSFIDSVSLVRDTSSVGRNVPTVVYFIVVFEIILFASFGAVSSYFRKRRQIKDLVAREYSYLTLSMVSKSLLTWLVVGGAMNAGVAQ
jgi:hypothetical protein